uniref:Transcription initiation factor TFIID subunit 12 n=1 Tax=Takifugu rubripes TaxID=31033 RepID=H2RUH7_TAKRU
MSRRSFALQRRSVCAVHARFCCKSVWQVPPVSCSSEAQTWSQPGICSGCIKTGVRVSPLSFDMLLQIADDFIESVVTAACQLARHRKSNTLEVKDVQLHLERQWNMWIPGFGSDEIRPFKKACTTEAHKQVRATRVDDVHVNPSGWFTVLDVVRGCSASF